MVSIATGGAEALASVGRAVPNLVVLDLMMPGIDGFAVLEQIRDKPWTERLPVVVLTAKELTADDRARLKHNNIQQVIQKGSVDKAELVNKVLGMLVREPVAPSANEAPAVSVPPSAVPTAERLPILVVEDNPDNLLTITAILDQAGYSYLTAADGRRAIEMAGETTPGLILMDMQLPVMSGEEVTRVLKADPLLSTVPVIAVTAKAMKGDRETILKAGCDDYVSKPIDGPRLLNLLRKWIP